MCCCPASSFRTPSWGHLAEVSLQYLTGKSIPRPGALRCQLPEPWAFCLKVSGALIRANDVMGTQGSLPQRRGRADPAVTDNMGDSALDTQQVLPAVRPEFHHQIPRAVGNECPNFKGSLSLVTTGPLEGFPEITSFSKTFFFFKFSTEDFIENH